jgi:hypothetical protein
MSPVKNNRPDCGRLLDRKSEWAIDKSEMEENEISEKLAKLSTEEKSIEQNFCYYFIETKLTH